MRDLIDLIERASSPSVSLKRAIIDLVKATDEDIILNRVLKVLKAGNLDQRVVDVVKTDSDAQKFVKDIADAILQIDAPVEEKNAFLDNFKNGVIDTEKLLDGKVNTIDQLVGAGFNTLLFKDLTTRLTSQGVGPGELALAIMSPKIKWSGRTGGGGDIVVDGKPVEVKTRVSSGGRWINTRKAKMDLQKIKDTLEKATGMQVPDRLNINNWVNTFRPAIQPKDLDKVTKIIADSIFKATDNTAYQTALKSGTPIEIADEHLRTGFKNYKALSNFEGILMVDLPTGTTQYFQDYDSMKGSIKNDSIYIYAPENEIMPKVTLVASAAPAVAPAAAASTQTTAGKPASQPAVKQSVPLSKAAQSIASGTVPAQQPTVAASTVTRKKRK